MLRPLSLLPALAAVASVAAFVLSPTAAHAEAPRARRAPATPLAVTIDTLSPSTIPKNGPIRVTGTVTNRDVETWTDIGIYAFVSEEPMTTSAELAEAAETDQDAFLGGRILTEGTYNKVDELAPGASATYSLLIPRAELQVDAEGVYWFGVHALGTTDAGTDDFADGRARTFLPLVEPPRKNQAQKTVQTALVVPIRHQVTHAPDGSIGDVGGWAYTLGSGGPLRSLVDLGLAAGSTPITWLVDPAVPDAVRRLVAGNPPRSLGPTTGDEGDGQGDPGESGSASPGASASPSEDAGDSGDGETELSPELQEAATAGSDWLEALHDGLEGHEILSLPYGDVDVAAAAKYDPAAYRTARKRAGDRLEPWGLPTSPVVSSPSGFIDAGGIRLAEPGSTVLVTDRLIGAKAPSVARTEGRTLVVSSSGAASGGPGPTGRMTPLAVRQRILSEAAVRLLTPGRKPLVVTLPTTWSSQSTSGFFAGLDVDWLDLTSVDAISRRPGLDVPADRLHYPDGQRRLELDADAFTAAGDLVQAGETLQNLLTRNDQVADEVRDEALSDTSYSSRRRPQSTQASANQSRAWIETRLRGVRIDAPKAVILSSGSGRFAATVSNSLDQAVSVKVRAVADPPLKVVAPTETIEIAADSRTTVLLNASSSGVGIRNVTLQLTDVDDVPLGSSDDLPIRANRVSNVIWLIMGTGVALLFGAILMRLVRRIRTAARS
ncbi:DUF6049 family protein [Nocardioides sp. T2.26MG-1]|uniref:DUF6049 family protein n=1 Tax=Nocardioides sp. T2.26MG-1 TaxID=3041166 RepID=UPI0024774E48|nr:DUF6049 family protein [Nocardioides sp. T2.26MG-1]CAI9402749.1 hypothetical protein HIDPHFAB_00881 [Nocardioides sp. T2.26MG-1]